MTPSFAIETFRLGKNYGRTTAVEEVTFCVTPGQVTAFLGQNGAGKSSTLKMLMGFLPPGSGHARVLGESITESQAEPGRSRKDRLRCRE